FCSTRRPAVCFTRAVPMPLTFAGAWPPRCASGSRDTRRPVICMNTNMQRKSETKPVPTPLFELRNLTKIYGRGLVSRNVTPALEDFSLVFDEETPKIITIAGESGSGKSTLANLALGFIHPTAGQILYKGKDIERFSRQERFNFRREVQAIFQDPFGTYNPFYKVDAVFEAVIHKFKLAHSRMEARKQLHEALGGVGPLG